METVFTNTRGLHAFLETVGDLFTIYHSTMTCASFSSITPEMVREYAKRVAAQRIMTRWSDEYN